jgi:hypothetical protein
MSMLSILLASVMCHLHDCFLCISGAQKCGTTSLYEYMAQHPLVVKGKRRETHYFDWRWNSKLATPEAQLNFCKCIFTFFFSSKCFTSCVIALCTTDMNFYHSELDKYPSLMTGESTPSYMLHGDIVIPRIKSVLPFSDIRFLVMLRDPVARAYSQYHMAIDMSGTPQQLEVRLAFFVIVWTMRKGMLYNDWCTVSQGTDSLQGQILL